LNSVSTTDECVFGAYLNCGPYPRIEEAASYGSGECFLFQLKVAGLLLLFVVVVVIVVVDVVVSYCCLLLLLLTL
jgi:hypothetical protein